MASRNPPWTRDELILALDLYFRHNPSHISKKHPEVAALSEILNRLPVHRHRPDSRFRNPDGVYMKLCNLLRFDPTYEGSGLVRGGRAEEVIWNEFANHQERLRSVAEAISANLQDGETSDEIPISDLLEEDDDEAPEGAVLLRQHKLRERNVSLVRKKKQLVLKKNGRLDCEACGFDFHQRYGAVGEGFIECHHTLPVSRLRPGQKTRLADLALVCSNCHRMLHRGGEGLTVEELRRLIRSDS